MLLLVKIENSNNNYKFAQTSISFKCALQDTNYFCHFHIIFTRINNKIKPYYKSSSNILARPPVFRECRINPSFYF